MWRGGCGSAEALRSFALAPPAGPWREVGRSVRGRSLRARWLGPAGRPPVLFAGVFHGDEPLGASLLLRLAASLEAAPPERQVILLPLLNPDGLLAGEKNNAHDVDLNRNFPATNWRADLPPPYGPGPRPGSEPETQAFLSLVEAVPPGLVVALHSPLRVVNYDGPAAAVAERMARRCGYPVAADIGYPTPGSLGSYLGVDRGVPIVTLEVPRLPDEAAWAENGEALREAIRAAL